MDERLRRKNDKRLRDFDGSLFENIGKQLVSAVQELLEFFAELPSSRKQLLVILEYEAQGV